jgi:RNA polymerase primary sigma factor
MEKIRAAENSLLLLEKSKSGVDYDDLRMAVEVYGLSDRQADELIVWMDRSGLIREDDAAEEKLPADLSRAYVQEISRYPVLSRQKEEQLARQAAQGDQLARNTLINCNLRLVVAIAGQYQGSRVATSDLIQEGNIGLVKAVKRYDPDRGVRFATYAQYWIRQAMQRAILQDHVIYVPANLAEDIRRLKRQEKQLEQQLERRPTDAELSAALGMPEEKVAQLKSYRFDALPMDKKINESGSLSLMDTLAIPAEKQEDDQLQRKLAQAMAALKPRDAEILRLRYGLDGGRPMTLQAIGGRYGLSKERVRQIINADLQTIRAGMQDDGGEGAGDDQ